MTTSSDIGTLQRPSTPITEDDDDDDEEPSTLIEQLVRNSNNNRKSNRNRNNTYSSDDGSGSRTSGKRTFPWHHQLRPAGEIKLPLPPPPPPPPQDEDMQVTKRPRLEKSLSFPTATDEAVTTTTTKYTTYDSLVALPSPPPAAATATATAADHVEATPTTGAPRCWTAEEDEKLRSAFTNTRKKKRGKKKSITNWEAIAALVSGRTGVQCRKRWHDASSVLSIEVEMMAPARKGKWTTDEDEKLKNAVLTHGGKNWVAIAAIVPGRTQQQCRTRWHSTVSSNSNPATARRGKWTTDEDEKLKNAVRAHGGKNWEAIATFVSGRTKVQCNTRWHDALNCSIDQVTADKCKWTAYEDEKLKNAVRAHGGQNWEAIAMLVPFRTKVQCRARWNDGRIVGRTGVQCRKTLHDAPVVKIDPEMAPRKGTLLRVGLEMAPRKSQWTTDEDEKLKNAVRAHGGKNWVAIAAFVSGRTQVQCRNRWNAAFSSNVDPATARKGNWTTDEDEKLKNVVRAHGGKNWEAIAAVVSGRTKAQCCTRWHDALSCSIGRVTARTCKWTAYEDEKLKNALRAHGGKNWEAIAMLVPFRTKIQCRTRWNNALSCNFVQATVRTGKWTALEHQKLENAVRAHGGKNWEAIAALVPGRTKIQCRGQWHDTPGVPTGGPYIDSR
jgi:hypothetical protein